MGEKKERKNDCPPRCTCTFQNSSKKENGHISAPEPYRKKIRPLSFPRLSKLDKTGVAFSNLGIEAKIMTNFSSWLNWRNLSKMQKIFIKLF